MTKIDGPCACPESVGEIEGDHTPSKPHHHLTARCIERHMKGKTYWLNGYTLDGRSVWGSDRLIDASQGELF